MKLEVDYNTREILIKFRSGEEEAFRCHVRMEHEKFWAMMPKDKKQRDEKGT